MTPAPAAPSVATLAARLGLPLEGAGPVREASRLVVRFPAAGVRTSAVPSGSEAPGREAAVADLLAAAGVPAARRVAGPEQVDGWDVTTWAEVPGVDPDAPPSPAVVLGALATHLHGATVAPRSAPCEPLVATRDQLDRADAVADDGATEVLRRIADHLDPIWRAAASGGGSPASIVHGDLHAGNVVTGSDGPVLVDLELAGRGPAAYDAAPTVAFVRWYGRPASDLERFDEGYGGPLTGAARTARLDEVWALWSASWAVANRHRSAAAAEEAEVRIATLRTGTAPRPWILR